MKKLILFLGIASSALLITTSLAGQCVPDDNCVDINEPGEICPAQLPSGVIGQAYRQSITILPPDSAFALSQQISIAYIVVDSVTNLPPGLVYTSYDEKFYPGTKYCIDISGIPTTAGEYTLAIHVEPFVNFKFGNITTVISGGPVVDDSSIVVAISSGTGINPLQTNKFQILSARPNPFNEKTRLGYFIPFDDEVVLQVFNILGEEIYHEVMMGRHGENYFEFDGAQLDRGAYFYGITHKSAWHTGKFIKVD